MIDKNWFELDKCKVFGELVSENYVYICLELDNRRFEITSNYDENNIHLSVNLWENHSNLCGTEYETTFLENRYVEEIKTLFKRWLLEKCDIPKLEIEFSKLIV